MKEGGSNRLLILTYHRVPQSRDRLIADPICSVTFDRQMSCLARWFNVVPLTEAISAMARASLPERAVAITFDDGYRDNCTVALPILRKYRLNATFFVTTGVLGSGRMWNDSVIECVRGYEQTELNLSEVGLGTWSMETNESKRSAMNGILKRLKHKPVTERNEAIEMICSVASTPLPNDLMMSPEQVLEMTREGMEIGAHTVNHPILAKMPDDQAMAEIGQSKASLEEITGQRVLSFAYPNGRPESDYNDRHVDMVRTLGFECAVSTVPGLATSRDDTLQLPRVAPWQTSGWKFTAGSLARFWARE